MTILIVVNDPASWPLDIPGGEVVAARTYLTDPRFLEMRTARVFNLCRSYRYQSLGYYVSLLAAARGHKPLPGVTAIEDLKSVSIVRYVSEDMDQLIQKSLAPIQSQEFTLSIYFGRNLAKRYQVLSLQLFKMFQAPLLRGHFVYNSRLNKWQLQSLKAISGSEIPESHRPFVIETAQEFFRGRGLVERRQRTSRYDLAILTNANEPEPPSNPRALKRFVKAAEEVGFGVELIDKEDFGRLGEFDALFIRETTNVNHHTYRFARRAAAEGLVVVDDPKSILRCTNKVFLAELLERHNIPAPRTMIVHRDNKGSIASELGFPCILKQPDSAFSRGVVKVENEEELKVAVQKLLEKSDLIIAQEFLPTEFDWRIGVFDRQPLFACKYFMAEKHWQILKRDDQGQKNDEGRFSTLPVEHAPPLVVRTALKIANLIGESLYGVDLKQVGKKVYVIEVNDNPNIDAGVEDQHLKDELYHRIMGTMLRRVEQRKERWRI